MRQGEIVGEEKWSSRVVLALEIQTDKTLEQTAFTIYAFKCVPREIPIYGL